MVEHLRQMIAVGILSLRGELESDLSILGELADHVNRSRLSILNQL